ncbi:type II toxin-antitoxin system RelE/ParE family toxin [Brevundimonas sp. DS20]|uniref:type II toxin-antitoxin system RelE/ParE family toxin n=1 Tax=Brevundimonas sp. DS20 TaxID=1532555 RepID=UPI0006D1A891|nr:type II toxin-antitoxin system RelE/ParE family toxin [Brevundimonas sp. DS20]ALJ07760.1 addiction module antitoxin RelB [Brevundimonas sp. DS20]
MSPIDDSGDVEIELTPQFVAWRARLRDARALAKIADRLTRLQFGHWGDVKPIGEGVSELRIDVVPGYRVYAFQRNRTWVVVPGGGDKSSQRRDIEAALLLARELRNAD